MNIIRKCTKGRKSERLHREVLKKSGHIQIRKRKIEKKTVVTTQDRKCEVAFLF